MEDERVELTKELLLHYFNHVVIDSIDTPTLRRLLHKEYKFTKRNLNKMLYGMKSKGMLNNDECIPPSWSVASVPDQKRAKIENNDDDEITFVMIDCDNRQKEFENACKVSNEGLLVFGFAGSQYNYFKPNEDDHPFCTLIQSKTTMKDLAEIEMCVKITQLCEKGVKGHFILVSGDKSILTLRHVIERLYGNYIGVTVDAITGTWDELKLEIE